MMKTPVTVLQELMIRHGKAPEYECVSKSGPDHMKLFEYSCRALGVSVLSTGRTKKEAKQEAARHALAALAARGVRVPPPYNSAPEPRPQPHTHTHPAPDPDDPPLRALPSSSTSAPSAVKMDARSYVALLKELCEEYKLGFVEYKLVGDTGPPHQRQFTMSAQLGRHAREAAANTKKAARQLAAERLYYYLRENLATATKDFVEDSRQELSPASPCEKEIQNDIPTKISLDEDTNKRAAAVDDVRESKRIRLSVQDSHDQDIVKEKEEALCRALDKAMERYTAASEDATWRPDLAQRLADYHLGLFTSISEKQREEARAALEADADADAEAEGGLQRAAAALGLDVQRGTLPAAGGALSVVSLTPATPALVFAGRNRAAADRAAARYLRRAADFRALAAPAVL